MTPLWHDISGKPIPIPSNFGVMGILNITPDSFFDGGLHELPALAASHAGEMLAEGADIIDIGAESTRPYARELSPCEECKRLDPALKRIKALYPEARLSVDTRNAVTAELALAAGCAVINDVSACQHDPGLIDVLAQYKPGYVLTHCRGNPQTMQLSPYYDDVVSDVKAFFEKMLSMLAAAGLPENRIILDPGIGFGKNLAHNLALLAHINEFAEFGRPLLIGISMKGFLGKLTNQPLKERGEATAIATALLYSAGVAWHRCHEVKRIRSCLHLVQALKNGEERSICC